LREEPVITTLIVDDEPLAREGLRVALGAEPDIEIVGEAGDGPSAVQQIREKAPQLVLLDVQMPGLDGFQVLQCVSRVPAVIFLTAHEAYAVRAFDAYAVDYLLKPISLTRLRVALDRARQHIKADPPVSLPPSVPEISAPKPPHTEYLQRIPVRDGDKFLMLRADEIDWIEGAANYVEVHARTRSFLVRLSMTELAAKLDPDRFARVHRSAIVNLDRIQEIRSASHGDFTVLLTGGAVVPMSRGRHKHVMKF
jgi:two-component system LytT family response regulator